jgi:hypothetical protein
MLGLPAVVVAFGTTAPDAAVELKATVAPTAAMSSRPAPSAADFVEMADFTGRPLRMGTDDLTVIVRPIYVMCGSYPFRLRPEATTT